MTLRSQFLRMILSSGFITTISLTLFIPFIVTKQVQSQTFSFAQKLVAVTNQKRVALVIGNSSYQTVRRLVNPANDAEDMAKTLEQLGFEVIKVIDGNHKQMDNALARFDSSLVPGVVGVFYYAGHGIEVDRENYLIPIDAQLRNEKDVNYEALAVGKIQAAMEKARISIIILDACRDNPFSRRWYRNIGTRGLAPIEPNAGSYIAFATAPGKVAEDGQGRNGTFTSYLLKYIKEPNLPIEKLFKKVRSAVIKETDSNQIPWESSSLTDEFSFNLLSTPSVQSSPKPQNPLVATAPPNATTLTPLEIANIAKQITVQIDGANTGSGVIIEHQGNTYTVVTSWHVLQFEGNYTVRTPDGKQYTINHNQVKRFPGVDLATFQFTSRGNYLVAKKGNSDQVTLGTSIFVAGYPQGTPEFRFLRGAIVSRLIHPKDGYAFVYDVGSFPGMSGGPILNEHGELVGIHGRAEIRPDTNATIVYGIPSNGYLKQK